MNGQSQEHPGASKDIASSSTSYSAVASIPGEMLPLLPFVTSLALRQYDSPFETFGAVTQIDIGGFSRAIEQHSRDGSVALEAIANLIGDCFNVLVDTVTQYGGIVHTFPGDGVIAIWEAPEEGLYDVTARASACAHVLAQSFPTSRRFPLKAGVGAGQLRIISLGHPGTRREILVTGEAMADAAVALRRARSGDTVLSARAQLLVPRAPRGRNETVSANSASRVPLSSIAATLKHDSDEPSGFLDFLPSLVRERLTSGLHEWIGEFRRASTIFIDIGCSELTADNVLQDAYALAQRCMEDVGGTIVQFCHDDKGIVGVMACGIENAHETDAARALRAAFAMSEGLAASDLRCSVGVTTDRVFCGMLGGNARREFRLIGAAVNHSARLMTSGRGVLCDENTRLLARGFGFGPPLNLHDRKGHFTAQQPRPRTPTTDTVPDRFRRHRNTDRTCGRVQESETASEWLREAGRREGSQGRILAFIGNAGIGKTQISSQLARLAQADGFRVVVSQAEELGPRIALRGFRPALEQLFDLGELLPESRRRVLTDAVAAATGSHQLTPLLDDVCPMEMPDNSITAALSGANRADNRLALLSSVIQSAVRTCARETVATVIFLEDAHWMDAGSWTLLDVLSATPDLPLHFVLTLRSVPNELPTAAHLINGDRTRLLRLDPLSLQDTAELIATRTGAAQTTPQLAQAVYRRAEGNPLFSCEIVRLLTERSLLVVESGTARLTGESDDIGGLVPESVEKILQARFDSLPATEQRLLKCASVVGLRFALNQVEVLRKLAQVQDLETSLEALIDAELIEATDRGGNTQFAFCHAIIRDVAYETLLHAQRRSFHTALALALEANLSADKSTLAIFNHWRQANESWRALSYVDEGGKAALREGDYHAAREYFSFGVQALADIRTGDEPDRYIRYNQQLGDVLVALGRHAQARSCLSTALRHLGEVVLRSRVGTSLLVLIEIAKQILLRQFPQFFPRRADDNKMYRSAEAYEQLGYVFYASGSTLHGVHAALAMLNRAERAPPGQVLARAFAAMSLTVSVTPLRRFGDFYERAALETADQLAEPAVTGWVAWMATLRAAGEGRWSTVFGETERSIEIARNASDLRLLVIASLTRAWALRVQGNIRESRQLAQVVLKLGRDHGNHLWEAWALLVEAECDLARHAYEAVIKSTQYALDILVEESDRTEEVRAGGLLAAALYAQGQESRALMVADRTVRLVRGVDFTSFLMLEGIAGLAEVYVSRYERLCLATNGKTDRETRRLARNACKLLARFSDVFPVARPRALFFAGRLLLASGGLVAARSAFSAALEVAAAFDMSRERVLIMSVLEERGLQTPSPKSSSAEGVPDKQGKNQSGRT